MRSTVPLRGKQTRGEATRSITRLAHWRNACGCTSAPASTMVRKMAADGQKNFLFNSDAHHGFTARCEGLEWPEEGAPGQRGWSSGHCWLPPPAEESARRRTCAVRPSLVQPVDDEVSLPATNPLAAKHQAGL